MLSKDELKRAEGELDKLVPTVKTRNGIQRYDVYIKNLRMVSYKPESLNRNGVAVIYWIMLTTSSSRPKPAVLAADVGVIKIKLIKNS